MAKKATKANGNGKASKTSKPDVEVQRMAYEGYCIAVGFDRSLTKAQAMLAEAKAKDKDGNYRWHLYLITPNKAHGKGTKQAKIAAQSAA